MIYYIGKKNSILQKMSRYLITHVGSYRKIKILPLLVWRNALTIEDIEKERSIIKSELSNFVIGSQKHSGLLKRSRNFEYIVSKLIAVSDKELKDIVLISKKTTDIKGITSDKSNTGYSTITIIKVAKRILVRLQVEHLGKRMSIIKKLDGTYSVEFLIMKFVNFRCKILGIEAPKEFNFNKALETARDLGYVNPSGEHIDIDFDMNDIVSSKIKKRDNKHITELIYNPINTTGYRHISIVDNGHGKPTMVLAIKIGKKEHRRTVYVNESNYKKILKEFIKEKMDLLNIDLDIDISYDKCLEAIRNIEKV